jgi:hypothetical protein
MDPRYRRILELERRHFILDDMLSTARALPDLLGLEPWEIGAIEERRFQLSAEIERLLS